MEPLAERMRPRLIANYVGQKHLVGEGQVLRQAIESQNIPSFILWGPPGVGKTTLATVIANSTQRVFFSLSAINAGVKDIRETLQNAQKQAFFGKPNPILFIDEIHRFSKSQQDALLGAVEKGVVTLIGATTENPSFEVNRALLSRCQVYVLEPLTKEELIGLVDSALLEDEFLKKKKIKISEYDALLRFSGGDARKLYNVLELVANYQLGPQELNIDNQLVTKLVQENTGVYDKGGEEHYDVASAFIKSIRGSDPDGALYWLARMIDGGEPVEFIGRRLMIAAAEDIGLANPNALLMAKTAFEVSRYVGHPEARIVLSQATIYLATSEKSNSAYLAIDAALAHVRQEGHQPVPLHLRNAPTALMKSLNYGGNYLYPHDYPQNFVAQEYKPKPLANTRFYEPQNSAAEQRIKQTQDKRWK